MTLDGIIEALSPGWAAARAKARHTTRLYDAAKSTPQRKIPTDRRSGDGLMEQARDKPRAWARHLDENLDLVTGLLNTLASLASAASVEPQVMTRGGELDDQASGQLAMAWETWTQDAEVTGGYTWSELVQLLARSWLRDGEVLIHHLEQSGIDYPGLPYQVQALEADYLPFDFTTGAVTHGVEKNSYGRATFYHLWTEHPGQTTNHTRVFDQTTAVAAQNISHLRRVHRFHQTRGISLLAPIITRLDDLRDYEESERIAARMAAAVCAVITRQPGYETPSVNATTQEREFYMQAGMVFDDMLPGEGIDLINPQRPNPNAGDWRSLQLKAIAAGSESSYSSIARDYSGSYSSQRQELVEHNFQVKRRLQTPFIDRALRPMYSRFARQYILSGALRAPMADPATLTMASYNSGATAWIDMLKEVQAEGEAVAMGFKSRPQVIRERGGDPRRVDLELERDAFTPASAPTEQDDERQNGTA